MVVSVSVSRVHLRNFSGRASVSHILSIAGKVPAVAHYKLEESVRVNSSRYVTVILHKLFRGNLVTAGVSRLMVLFKSLLEFRLDLIFSPLTRLDIRVARSFESLQDVLKLKHAYASDVKGLEHSNNDLLTELVDWSHHSRNEFFV